jgi:hypothetical protein
MRKAFILMVAFVLAAGMGVFAQSSAPKASDKGANDGGKGGSYLAPVTIQKTAVTTNAGTPSTGSLNTSVTKSESNSVVIPSDFPRYVNTGNVAQDSENYRIAKDEWIRKNPERYKEMQTQSSNTDKK